MKFSLITATFNRSEMLQRAISSVKGQTYSNIQSIVIDGGSSDDTVSKVTPLLSRNDIIVSDPDDGIYDALNKGLKLATGDVIGFLHSDDVYFDKDVIAKVANEFLDEEVNVVYGDVCFFSQRDEDKIIRVYRSREFTKKSLAWGKMPAHPAMFIRRNIFEILRNFDTDFKIAADYEFMCRLVQYENLNAVYLPEILVRMQIGGISTGGLKNTLVLNKEVLKALKRNKINSNLFMLISKYPSKFLEFLKK